MILQSLIVSPPFAIGTKSRRTACVLSLKKRTFPADHLLLHHPSRPTAKPICCVSSSNINIITKPDVDEHGIARRSGNYPPSSWDYNTIQSLRSDFMVEKYGKQANELKDDVRNLIVSDMAPLAKLGLIDCIQRLGLEYQFEADIKKELDRVYREKNCTPLTKDDHYSWTFLAFRLFRQHGFDLSTETFGNFKDETGNFRASLCCDAKGLLSLYEASFYGFEGETILDEARVFATSNLKKAILLNGISPILAKRIKHALETPLHWGLLRVEARWYIETTSQEEEEAGGGGVNTSLLEFAKLDYNMVQCVHQKEVKKLADWWEETGLSKMKSFARDRLGEHFLWCCGIMFEPRHEKCREVATKVISFTSVMDDLYDIYGTVDELEIVTHFINRWDITGIDVLPYNIKVCLLSFFNNMNDIGYWLLKETGVNIIPSLSKAWGDQLKLNLFEAKCYNGVGGPVLKLEEYLAYSLISVAAAVVLYGTYYFTTEDKLTAEGCNDLVANMPHIMYWSCRLIRLNDDLGTTSAEMARGDNMKGIECYMKEAGVGEEEARKHLQHLVIEGWKAMNKELMGNSKQAANYPLSPEFLRANLNFVRASYCMYQFGDGHGFPGDHSTKDHITNLLVKPIP